MDQDRHTALQLAHEAEGGRSGLATPDGAPAGTDAVLARAEKYLAFLQAHPRPGSGLTHAEIMAPGDPALSNLLAARYALLASKNGG